MISKLNAVPHTPSTSFLLNSNQKRDRISQPGIFPLVCIVPTIYSLSPSPTLLFPYLYQPLPPLPSLRRLSTRVFRVYSSPLLHPPPMSAFFLLPTPLPGPFHGVARGTGIVSRYPRIPRPLATRNKGPTMGPRRDLQPYLPPLCYSFPRLFLFFLLFYLSFFLSSFFPSSSSLFVSRTASGARDPLS